MDSKIEDGLRVILPNIDMETSAFSRWSGLKNSHTIHANCYTKTVSLSQNQTLINHPVNNITNSDYNTQTQIDHISDELHQSMIKTFSTFIFDIAPKEYLDLTDISYAAGGFKTEMDIAKRTIIKMDSIYRKNIITNGRICSDILDYAAGRLVFKTGLKLYNYSKSTKAQKSFITELGNLEFTGGTSNLFTDSNMRYDSNYIIMYDEALLDWDIKRAFVNNHYGSVAPQVYVDIDEHMLVVNPVVLYVFTANNRNGYEKFIAERREEKINTLLDENKRLG